MLEPPTNIEQVLSAAEDHKMERKVSGPWVKIKKQTKKNKTLSYKHGAQRAAQSNI